MKFYIYTSYDDYNKYKENKELHIEKYADVFRRLKKFNITKEKGSDKYFIEINSLEELVELLKLARKDLILKEMIYKDPCQYGIEIYDWYTEENEIPRNRIYGITGLPKKGEE